MVMYHIAALLIFLALAGAVVVRYVFLTIDREFRNLARAATDETYRDEELQKANRLLAAHLPLPNDVEPLPKPAKTWWNAMPSLLLAVGIILLWGGLFAPRPDKSTWWTAGAAAGVLAAVIMLVTLRTRRRARVARILRNRADLERLAGNHREAVADLRELLRLTPWDDPAWAELGDGYAQLEDVDNALLAYGRAAELDPDYEDYFLAPAGLALLHRRVEDAARIIDAWRDGCRDPRPSVEARQYLYHAAVSRAKGNEGQAKESFARALRLDEDTVKARLDLDESLAGIAELEDAVEAG